MQSSTYKDIIDDKVAEWSGSLKKIEEYAKKEPSDTKKEVSEKIRQLRIAIDEAIVKLRKLDEQETVDNTMETKDKILHIFSSIDKDLSGYDTQAPFML
ncbi:MAG: hypothetical protein ACWGOX_07000 [Desulforhopalus sp.]